MASEDCGGRINQKAKVDRISNLPDEVISQILSLLPTKSAVGTSILSKRWKYLWTCITSFHFENPRDEDKRFKIFVDKVFRSCNSSNIQKVTMHAPQYWNDNSRVEAWMHEAIKRNVRQVDLNVQKIPLSIFSCKTLTVLTLVVRFGIDLNKCSIDLPCLKVLHFYRGCQPKPLVEKLISSCPVLEDLTLNGALGDDNWGSSFRVDAPTLKSLRLKLWGTGNREIYVNAPNLENLYLSEYFVKYKIKGDFSSIVKASVDIEDIYLGSRYNPFHPERKDPPYGFTLRKLHNLKYLELITCHHLFWPMLLKFIKTSPSLEVLSIKQSGDNMPPDDFVWVGPKLLPKCLRSHLSTIKIEGFKGRKHELQLLGYFLGNAKVLQRLMINCQGLKYAEKLEFSEQLLKISKASRCCQIIFQGDLNSEL